MASAPLGLAEIEAMIGDAEVEIVALRHRLACDGGPTPDPTDPLDELSCLEILAAGAAPDPDPDAARHARARGPASQASLAALRMRAARTASGRRPPRGLG